jgi:hypothetical protein
MTVKVANLTVESCASGQTGDEFTSLSKAGRAGSQVTEYTQTWSDVEARIERLRCYAGLESDRSHNLGSLACKPIARQPQRAPDCACNCQVSARKLPVTSARKWPGVAGRFARPCDRWPSHCGHSEPSGRALTVAGASSLRRIE